MLFVLVDTDDTEKEEEEEESGRRLRDEEDVAASTEVVLPNLAASLINRSPATTRIAPKMTAAKLFFCIGGFPVEILRLIRLGNVLGLVMCFY